MPRRCDDIDPSCPSSGSHNSEATKEWGGVRASCRNSRKKQHFKYTLMTALRIIGCVIFQQKRNGGSAPCRGRSSAGKPQIPTVGNISPDNAQQNNVQILKIFIIIF